MKQILIYLCVGTLAVVVFAAKSLLQGRSRTSREAAIENLKAIDRAVDEFKRTNEGQSQR